MSYEDASASFVDRRDGHAGAVTAGRERRQFGNTYDQLSPPARELAEKIDEYKLLHHRRFITYEELYGVIASLGYYRSQEAAV